MEAEAHIFSARGDSSAIGTNSLKSRRVALAHDWLTGMRGGEKCLEILCRIFPDAEIHTLLHRRGSLSQTIENMRIKTSPLQMIPGIDRHYRHWLPLMPAAARTWRVGEVDLVFSLSHCVAKSVRAPADVPHVCYCFTPMRYAWQLRDAYLDRWSNRPLRRAAAKILLNRLREWDRRTADGVDHFIAISETVRERIATCYGRTSTLIPPPVDVDFYTPAAVARENFYLCVSALVPYKRIERAVEACTRSKRRLVVIGEGPERKSLEAIAGPNVSFLGRASDDEIRDHLRRCRALLFPGEEDFGITPIEALACGAPVIALGKGGVAETVDDRVGRVYTDDSIDGLVAAIDAWEAMGTPHDAVEGRRRAERFSTVHFNERIVEFLDRVTRRTNPTREPLFKGPISTRRDRDTKSKSTP